jgi:hypothetical protein
MTGGATMKLTNPTEVLIHTLICDRCGRHMELAADRWEWHETMSISFPIDYEASNDFPHWHAIDLCQHCLQFALGRHLRIIEGARGCGIARARHTDEALALYRRAEAQALLDILLQRQASRTTHPRTG